MKLNKTLKVLLIAVFCAFVCLAAVGCNNPDPDRTDPNRTDPKNSTWLKDVTRGFADAQYTPNLEEILPNALLDGPEDAAESSASGVSFIQTPSAHETAVSPNANKFFSNPVSYQTKSVSAESFTMFIGSNIIEQVKTELDWIESFIENLIGNFGLSGHSYIFVENPNEEVTQNGRSQLIEIEEDEYTSFFQSDAENDMYSSAITVYENQDTEIFVRQKITEDGNSGVMLIHSIYTQSGYTFYQLVNTETVTAIRYYDFAQDGQNKSGSIYYLYLSPHEQLATTFIFDGDDETMYVYTKDQRIDSIQEQSNYSYALVQDGVSMVHDTRKAKNPDNSESEMVLLYMDAAAFAHIEGVEIESFERDYIYNLHVIRSVTVDGTVIPYTQGELDEHYPQDPNATEWTDQFGVTNLQIEYNDFNWLTYVLSNAETSAFDKNDVYLCFRYNMFDLNKDFFGYDAAFDFEFHQNASVNALDNFVLTQVSDTVIDIANAETVAEQLQAFLTAKEPS
ncbi:MAG: hypothetical protein FWH03_01380 [Firmicutes bacterium]|nr:hypothetical protein [Bacillota bacterium]